MSLRTRLIVSILVVMMAAICLSGVVVIWNGKRQVYIELSASLNVATATARNNFRFLHERPDRRRVLQGMVHAFDGSRAVKAILLDSAHREIAASLLYRPADPPPTWLIRLLRPAITPRELSFPDGHGAHDELVLRTSPINETAEVWANIRDDALFVLIFVGLSLLLIWRTIDWIVMPVEQLSRGIAQLRVGRAEHPVPARGPRELQALIGAFNALVRDLALRETEARVLEDQVLRIQEEERADLARDLHDDVGPLLFLAKVDLNGVIRRPELRDHNSVTENLIQVVERLGRIQNSLRDMLARLRPRRELDDGLESAISALLVRWRAHAPTTTLELVTEGDLALLNDGIADATFRIVREAVQNALRHARPERIRITVSLSGMDRLDILITDDGTIQTPEQRQNLAGESSGLGLKLMREQAMAYGGGFYAGPAPTGGGWTVRATLRITSVEVPAAA